MTEQEFLDKRVSFILDPETMRVIKPNNVNAKKSHAEWMTISGFTFPHTIRGYYWKDTNKCFIMLYWNNFETPNMTVAAFSYLFEYFKDIQFIGLGCKEGKVGELWEPKYKIFKNE